MILVTGASGTVGSEVVRQLRAQGAPVRVASRTRAQGDGAVHVDFANPASLAPALAGADALFLLGATAPNQSELETNVVTAAKKAGVKKIVKLSVFGADTEAFGFARIHRAVEKAIEASGLAFTFLRPNGFMQNVVNYYAGSIKAQGAFYGSAGAAQISHVDVRDIAAVAVAALTAPGHEGKGYTLTGPEPLTYDLIAAKVGKAIGKPVSYVNLTDEQSKQGMLGAGMPEFYADLMVDLMRYYRGGTASLVSPDIEKVTGKKARSFDKFLADHLAAFR